MYCPYHWRSAYTLVKFVPLKRSFDEKHYLGEVPFKKAEYSTSTICHPRGTEAIKSKYPIPLLRDGHSEEALMIISAVGLWHFNPSLYRSTNFGNLS